MTTDHTIRDGMINSAVESRRVDETKIMQKVNAVNREAFTLRFPGHIEHSMRLISERLQNCLVKPHTMDLSAPDTWPATPAEIESLAAALWSLEQTRLNWPTLAEK
jgi:hypothetical protein